MCFKRQEIRNMSLLQLSDSWGLRTSAWETESYCTSTKEVKSEGERGSLWKEMNFLEEVNMGSGEKRQLAKQSRVVRFN